MELMIRQGTLEDLDEMEQLYDEANETLERGTNYPGWKKGIYPIREDAKKAVEMKELFVARCNGKIAGSVILSHEPENGYENAKWQYDWDYDSIYVIRTLVVHPDYTKSGVGTQLMAFAESFGKQNHMRAIRLDVYEKNMPAVKLYESCGYQYIGNVDLGLGFRGLDWFRLYEKLL